MRPGFACAVVGWCLVGAIAGIAVVEAQPAPPVPVAKSPPPAARPAYFVQVPLPIVGTVDTQVKRQIDQLVGKPAVGGQRPLLILEFGGNSTANGLGSEFERSLSLARYLASERLSGVRSVAFLPRSVLGHAVLPVLACEELVVAEDAEFGEAGRDEGFIDLTMRRGYSEIADRRRLVPAAVALGMLDRQLSVHRVQTTDGVRYVLEEELRELQQRAAVTAVETVSRAGDWTKLTGRDLRLKFGFASHLAANRRELAAALRIHPGALQDQLDADGQWRAVRVELRGPIHSQQVNFIERNLRQRLERGEFNFLCVVIESPGGSASDAWRLAQFLASPEMNRARTVALVPEEARGSAALVALACDQLLVGEDAILGGDGADELNAREREALLASIRDSAEQTGRDWSLLAGMVDPQLTIHRYMRQASGESRFLSEAELADLSDPESWTRGEPLEVRDGLRGGKLVELNVATGTARSLEELQALYHLETEPVPVEPNWAHLFIERLAHPAVAGVLLFIAIFALMIEFSQPGVGLPGFISAVCFILYFWSHVLHGTAGWLEVLLFLTGVTSVLVEIFVIPGGFVFGLGGGLLIVISIVLASQTFVIPRNAYQVGQLPSSIGSLGVIAASALAALAIARRYLPEAPLFRKMMLPPPDDEELEDLSARESLTHLHHLLGKRGRTVTRLLPSGKALFGDELVGVATEGEALEAGTEVVAVADRGNYLLVERADRPMA